MGIRFNQPDRYAVHDDEDFRQAVKHLDATRGLTQIAEDNAVRLVLGKAGDVSTDDYVACFSSLKQANIQFEATRGHGGRSLLEDAVEAGNSAAVAALWKTGADLSQRCVDRSETLLHRLVQVGGAAAVQRLAQDGVPFDDAALLHDMCDRKQTATVKALLHAGASPGGASARSPLLAAIMAGDPESVAALVDHGADPNAYFGPPAASDAALVHAMLAGSPDVVRTLLEKGADPNAACQASYSAAAAVAHVVLLSNQRAPVGATIYRDLCAHGFDPSPHLRDGKPPVDRVEDKNLHDASGAVSRVARGWGWLDVVRDLVGQLRGLLAWLAGAMLPRR